MRVFYLWTKTPAGKTRSTIGWEVVVVDEEFCDVHKGVCKGGGGILLPMRLDGEEENNEARIMRGKVAEK